MKKIVSVLVLSVFLTHLVGFYIYFVVRQAQIHQEMREAIKHLPADEFEILVLTEKEYLLARVNDHEVKINGKMYDHSSPEFDNEKVILHAKHDKAEDSLIGFLNEVVSSASTDKRPVPSQVLIFFSLAFIPASILVPNPILKSETQISFYSQNLDHPHYPVESPPPKG